LGENRFSKSAVLDNTVIAVSHDFRAARRSTARTIFLESAALTERYSVYIDHVLQKYADAVVRL